MIWINYLKIGMRNMLRQKLLSFINIFSLAFGIAAFMLIFLFIRDERKFDAFHGKADQIYRLDEVQSFPGTNTQNVALSMPGMGPALLRDYPEVEDFTRYWARGNQLFVHGDKRHLIETTAIVDSTFLELFDFQLLAGDRTTALDEPNALVISQTTARKFFDTEDPLGKTLTFDDNAFVITGLMDDVPEHSHLQFDILQSMASITRENPGFNTRFGSNFLNTYLLFAQETDMAAFEARMPDFLLRCMPPDPGDTRTVNDAYKLFFQPLSEVHLASMDIEHDYNNYRKFNGAYLGIFQLIGIFILLIAGLNFMNLITARAAHRGKEIGVRKSIGAVRTQLLAQFITEAGLLSILSFVIALGLAWSLAPILSDLVDRDLDMHFFLEQPLTLLIAFGGSLLLGFLSSVYPALYMSSFNPTEAIKGSSAKGRPSLLKSSLIILQFGLAIGMIISTIIVVKQLYFIRTMDAGFDKEHIILVDMNGEANDKLEPLRSELTSRPHISGVTASGQRIGNNFHQWGFKLRTDTIMGLTPSNVNVDYDYLKVYGIDLVKGRGFDRDRPNDNGLAYVINESLAGEIGIADPVGVAAGHSWYPDDSLGTIIGVARDFHFNSLHYDINTLAMVVHPEWGYDELSIKLDGSNIEAAIAHAERTWTQLVPSWPFQYQFLDEHFAELYRSEQQMQSVTTAMAILAILIASMGLFGLAALSAEKRMKEVGVRKILGASVPQIVLQLSKRFALLVVVGFVLFAPVTWFLMRTWLQNYTERISLGPAEFAIGFALAFLIAMSTVGYHAMRAASVNPADVLRDE